MTVQVDADGVTEHHVLACIGFVMMLVGLVLFAKADTERVGRGDA